MTHRSRAGSAAYGAGLGELWAFLAMLAAVLLGAAIVAVLLGAVAREAQEAFAAAFRVLGETSAAGLRP